MASDRASLVLPWSLILVGTGWLLTTLKIAPGVDWVWTLLLAGVGFTAFALTGLDKVTAVVGPLFLLASLFSVLRQTGQLHLDVEIPILVIFAGALMIMARAPGIRPPSWLSETPTSGR